MKMLAFVISIGVLYWAMSSYAQTRLAGAEPCPELANITSIGANHSAEAGEAGETGEPNGGFQLVQMAAADAGDQGHCAR